MTPEQQAALATLRELHRLWGFTPEDVDRIDLLLRSGRVREIVVRPYTDLPLTHE